MGLIGSFRPEADTWFFQITLLLSFKMVIQVTNMPISNASGCGLNMHPDLRYLCCSFCVNEL